ncbi:hypothetical protein QOZ80_5AG0397810 [Eleusine coracana subsp. coracana]|nr:hypothetical protein QOZ80_5AG0397810 [Eleusine coracana subsp. coracana]
MLVLNLCEMKFSLVLNDKCHHLVHELAIMDAAEDRLGLLALKDKTLDFYTKTGQNNGVGVGAEEWRHDKLIPLPKLYGNYYIIGATKNYVLLGGVSCSNPSFELERERQCFVVNLETLLVERLCMLPVYTNSHPYATFPPLFSLPSLENCKN